MMARKLIDRTGMRFGRLIVKSDSNERSKRGSVLWFCVCDCGGSTKTIFANLNHGKTKSCGCLAKELSGQRAKKLFSKPDVICKVDDCINNTRKGANGYCGMHYARWKRYGDHTYITPEAVRRENSRNAQIESKLASMHTYKKLYGVHEHRAIAQKILNRPLLASEHVHHIDGNKHNNEPSNLCVMSRSDHLKLHAELSNKGYTNVSFTALSEKSYRSNLQLDDNK
jgi:hypothetical protein